MTCLQSLGWRFTAAKGWRNLKQTLVELNPSEQSAMLSIYVHLGSCFSESES